MTHPRAGSVPSSAPVRVVVARHEWPLAEHPPVLEPSDDAILPRQAFDLIVTGTEPDVDDPLGELVSLRNSLTRDGALLLIARAECRGEIAALANAAGFTHVRDVGMAGTTLITLELKR